MSDSLNYRKYKTLSPLPEESKIKFEKNIEKIKEKTKTKTFDDILKQTDKLTIFNAKYPELCNLVQLYSIRTGNEVEKDIDHKMYDSRDGCDIDLIKLYLNNYC